MQGTRGSRRRSGLLSRLAGAVVVVAVALALGGRAAADTATGTVSLSLSPAADAITDATPFRIVASGTTDDVGGSAALDVETMPVGTRRCPIPPSGGTSQYTPGTITGSPFSVSTEALGPWERGDYVLCAWIVDGNVSPEPYFAASAPLAFTVRPAETIALQAAPNPALAGHPVKLVATGRTYDFTTVYLTSKPDAAGAGCASSPGTDRGEPQDQADDTGWSAGGQTSYTVTVSATFDPGRYLLCAWLMPAGAPARSPPIVHAVSTVLDVKVEHFKEALTVSAPSRIGPHATARITVRYLSTGRRALYVDVGPASAGCASRYELDTARTGTLSGNYHADPTASAPQPGQVRFDWDGVGPPGRTSGSITYTVPAPALTSRFVNPNGSTSFRVCAWLEPLPSPGGVSTGAVSAGPVSARLALTGVNLPRPGPPTTYSGTSRSHGSLALLVEGNQITEFRWAQTFSCPGPVELVSPQNPQFHERWNGSFTDSNQAEVLIGADGRFTLAAPGDAFRPAFTVRGRQHGKTIDATFDAEFKPGPPDYKAAPGTVCRTGTLRMTLRAGR